MWVWSGASGNVDHYLCKSDTDKPTGDGVKTGSDAYEVDTGNLYIFDGSVWVQQ